MKNALLNEALFVFSEITRKLKSENGRPMHISTLARWRQAGIRGVRLEAIRLGGRWATSLEAVDRFITALAEVSANQISTPVFAKPKLLTSIGHELDKEGL
jgi:hypothetical protein